VPISILIFGCDPLLLTTRKWVLRSSGHRVWTATTSTEVAYILSTEPIVVLILCHTLSLEERRQGLALAAQTRAQDQAAPGQTPAGQLRPRVKTLLLTAGVSPEPLPFLAEVVDAMEGPARLLEAVRRIVASDITLAPYPNPC